MLQFDNNEIKMLNLIIKAMGEAGHHYHDRILSNALFEMIEEITEHYNEGTEGNQVEINFLALRRVFEDEILNRSFVNPAKDIELVINYNTDVRRNNC